MPAINRRRLAVFVACAALAGFFLYWDANNDHYDRLARARQIAVYGEVPFRDFFDPGYFLTLYASAFMERVLGDNLLGEMLLNISAMVAGTTIVFLLASRASGSALWGLAAAGLTVVTKPRSYDYDKVLFYPLGLWACWRYIDRPTVGRLLSLAGITVIAGLFRYDTAVYLGVTAVVAIVIVHSDDWRRALRRVASLGVAMLLFASPALFFVHATAGLGDAFDQITTYAKREGARSALFRLSSFDLDWSLSSAGGGQSPDDIRLWHDVTWLPGVLRPENGEAWLQRLALVTPVLVAVAVPLRRSNRTRATLARILSGATVCELVALFILRDPVRARIGGVMPILAVTAGLLVAEWRAEMRRAGPTRIAARGRQAGLLAVAIAPCVVTLASIWGLFTYPPLKNLEVRRRLSEYAAVPPDPELIPKGATKTVTAYIRSCTKPTDRFFAPWFAGELYYFSGRAFAGGLPVVFGDHWSELRYQRRSLRIFNRQRVPIILMLGGELEQSYPFVWQYVVDRYELARTVTLGPFPDLQVWVKRGLPITRLFGDLALPCYAP